MENTEKKYYCLLDSATMHSILTNKVYFSSVKLCKAQVTTISGLVEIIDGSGNATLMLSNGTILQIENTLLSSRSKRKLLSFKDVRDNGYRLETLNDHDKECLCIASYKMGKKNVREKFEATISGLYYVPIKAFESYTTMPWKLVNPDIFGLWHYRLGHPGTTMMRRIVKHTNRHPLKGTKMLISKYYFCESCSQGKFIARPLMEMVGYESPSFVQCIHGDICGPIHPSSRPSRYFMVLIDASCRWSHVCLLSTRNVAFARLLAQIIKLRAHFPNYPIKNG
ncbi:hypothetical protein DH2020_048648 [Rehmannia glutinosa]|uniref:GAG-pre-integrase domain-containing protein n=1 Tax=Rehmannia glutinosa TaxID=99300 RepID=A0ABR0U5N1_REHGL